VATLPAIAAVLLIAPWPEMFIKKVAGRAAIMPVVLPALGAAFVVSAFFAGRALKNIMPGRPIWTLLLLVPVLHWFAAHRLLRDMEVRLEQQLRGPDAPASPETTAGTAMTIADLALVLGALGWAAWVIMGSRQTGFGIMGVLVRLFSILFGSLFAIADVAVMENVQRKYVALIRKR